MCPLIMSRTDILGDMAVEEKEKQKLGAHNDELVKMIEELMYQMDEDEHGKLDEMNPRR